MILPVFNWWLISTILSVAAFPLNWRFFNRLPDRGFGFARIMGLLVCGYGFWLGASLQLLPNSVGGVLAVLAILIVAAIYAARERWQEIKQWLRARWRVVLVMELLFLFAFIAWAFIRANNPEITGTEKPMELAFINSILMSDGFPPRDPWLSGYAISYYYLGYVLLSLMVRLTGVTAGIGFNLGNSLWFALVAVGTYSILFNWINRSNPENPRYRSALLGPIMTLISGNLAGFLEILHSRHVFWASSADGILRSRFWTWLGLQDLEVAPIGPPSWIPQRYLWWWRSSRVVRDLDLNGVPIGTQSIDEFPFFSFLLADNHPHLLALPVALLALAFALQLFFSVPSDSGTSVRSIRFDLRRLYPFVILLLLMGIGLGLLRSGDEFLFSEFLSGLIQWMLLGGLIFAGVFASYQAWSGNLEAQLTPSQLVLGGWLIGGLAFLNTWDFLPYFCVIGMILIWRSRSDGLVQSLKGTSLTLFIMIFFGAVFYLPWYPTFASQLSGILPHMLQPTRFPHFVTMFGPSLLPISIWMIVEIQRAWRRDEWRWLLGISLGVPIGLLFLSWALAAGILAASGGPFSMESILGTLGVTGVDEMIRSTLRIRLTGSWTALYLGGMLGAATLLLRRRWAKMERSDAHVWVLFLVIVGALLIIGPEFLYLRDQFGLRMNTIFKFYYAAWILWSLAAGIMLVEIWGKRRIQLLPLQLLITLPLLMGLVYPVASVWTKTQGFKPVHGRTLEGSMHPAYMNDDDRKALKWMEANLDRGVIAEAVGGSYTYYARVSTHTGLPTVLGWPGHEGQWRGGYLEQGSRQDDLRLLYQSPDWPATLEIMNRYGIDYIYIGELERRTYAPVSDAKFDAYMRLIFANETVQIYAREEAGSS